jgi:hypothetical protein
MLQLVLIFLFAFPFPLKASDTNAIVDLGDFSAPHPGIDSELGWSLDFAGKRSGYFLLHQCFEGREIASLQKISKNLKKKPDMVNIRSLQRGSGGTIACHQENWFVFSVINLGWNYFTGTRYKPGKVRLFCVGGNLVEVDFLEIWVLGASDAPNRCSLNAANRD